MYKSGRKGADFYILEIYGSDTGRELGGKCINPGEKGLIFIFWKFMEAALG